MTELSLPQALFLLALDPEKGTLRKKEEVGYAVAGACLAELALLGRVHLDVTKRALGPITREEKDVRLADPAPTDLRSCDELLRRIADEPVRSPQKWVEKLHGALVEPVVDELEARGIVRRERGTRFGLLPTTRYEVADPAVVRELREALDAVVRGGITPTERTASLAVLVDATGLIGDLVPGVDKRTRKARMAQLKDGQWAGAASSAAIEAAAAAAGAAASVTVTTT